MYGISSSILNAIAILVREDVSENLRINGTIIPYAIPKLATKEPTIDGNTSQATCSKLLVPENKP